MYFFQSVIISDHSKSEKSRAAKAALLILSGVADRANGKAPQSLKQLLPRNHIQQMPMGSLLHWWSLSAEALSLWNLIPW
jgi:hypothetical protein